MAADRSYVTKNREQLERLRGLVDKLSDQELSRPMDAGWTVAAVLAHLAFWDYRIVTLLDEWNASGTPPWPPISAWPRSPRPSSRQTRRRATPSACSAPSIDTSTSTRSSRSWRRL